MADSAWLRARGAAGATTFDAGMLLVDLAGFARVRRGLLGQAYGRVLDVGAGGGLNLAWLPPAVSEVVLAEPDAPALERARVRLVRHGATPRRPAHRVHLVRAVGEALPLGANSVDTVVVTLVLCSVGDPRATLAEIVRVLRPGGRLLFAEHVRSPSAGTAAWQDRLARPWARVAGGCRLGRDTLAALEASGLCVERVADAGLRGVPAVFRPMVVGSARRAETVRRDRS